MEKQYDVVENPAHYTDSNIECIDAMVAAKGVDSVIAFCECMPSSIIGELARRMMPFKT